MIERFVFLIPVKEIHADSLLLLANSQVSILLAVPNTKNYKIGKNVKAFLELEGVEPNVSA